MKNWQTIAFLFLAFCLSAQDNIVLTDSILPSTRGLERNPYLLVNKLTEDKKSEIEKFDAIFTWVTKNIRYNYYAYLSPTGAGIPRIKWILKYKTGICIDYAFLMDTLCQLAGIKNISVYGYAKDDLFDVHDSIYMDNHAWNAVKLNNYWYLYDVTWSSGQYKWQYTKFSTRILNWKRKILAKKKTYTITFKANRKTECDTFNNTFTRTYISLSKFNLRLLKFLNKIKIKKKLVFTKVRRPDFYLTNPEVFAITHFPDNPYWSLTPTMTTIRAFETDSAYYHLNDNVYINQKREPRTCIDCDNYFSLDQMNKEKQMKNNSYNFNKRNKFIIWLSNYNIANLYFDKSIPEKDSLTKISLIDSSLSYLNLCKDDLYQCLYNVHTESQLQRTKNATKERNLYIENLNHIEFVHSILKSTYEETYKMSYFARESDNRVKKFRSQKSKLYLYGETKTRKPGRPKTKEKIMEIQNKLVLHRRSSDSLTKLINDQVANYNSVLSLLSDNLWKRIKIQDSLSKPFAIGFFYRWLYLLDNYKKPIAEQRKKIEKLKAAYSQDITNEIFIPSDSCAIIGNRIFNLIEVRNNQAIEATKLFKTLVEDGNIDKDSLRKHIKDNSNDIQKNICWIIGSGSKLKSVTVGYKRLLYYEKGIENAIRSDSRAEFDRYKFINKEIARRYRKFRNVPMHNLRVTAKKKNLVTRYKRDYLKSLKIARKKAVKL